MVTGIEHVAIASPDPLRLARWYVEHLGFLINYQSAHSKTVFIKAADGSMVEIIESAPDTAPAENMNAAGLRHLALTVTDFPSVYAGLKEQGVRFLTDAEDHQRELAGLLYGSGRQYSPPAAPRNATSLDHRATRSGHTPGANCSSLATLQLSQVLPHQILVVTPLSLV